MEIIKLFKMIDQSFGRRIWIQFFKSVYAIFKSIEVPLLLSYQESENQEESKM